jgi:hypothetical protein
VASGSAWYAAGQPLDGERFPHLARGPPETSTPPADHGPRRRPDWSGPIVAVGGSSGGLTPVQHAALERLLGELDFRDELVPLDAFSRSAAVVARMARRWSLIRPGPMICLRSWRTCSSG